MSRSAFTVTGPGCEGKRAPAEGPAFSLALALAARRGEPATFYVRGPEGSVLHRLEREPDGRVRSFRPEASA